ncbi:MAG: hypothetical protein M1818_004638 [Claussenomyces sp. TS43310]|nr:MAG: hypothetical protein M1818_004638 [Claussenomyces sp. TS43310]
MANDEYDFLPYAENSQRLPSSEPYTMDHIQGYNMDPSIFAYAGPRDSFEEGIDLASGSMYTEHLHLPNEKHSSHPFLVNSPEFRAPASTISTMSGQSAASSIVGSPYSNHGTTGSAMPEWTSQDLGLGPSIVGYDTAAREYSFASSGTDVDFAYSDLYKPGFVDPSLIHGYPVVPTSAPLDNSAYHPSSLYPLPASPALSQRSHRSSSSSKPVKQNSPPPYHSSYPYPPTHRRPSLHSHHSSSNISVSSPSSESGTKGACPHPDCGKTYKDLKAHMLTHQNERPEKCPIATCEYHIKGFARKYDKNRHTLTHYKDTMVCGFCPGSGSAAEKSFNRADVFKRHLTSVHGVEQTPPNSRKKAATSSNSSKKSLAGYAPDATGKCSTCSSTFSNAQDFYEHLDDCVLRIVQQEEPSEAINAKHLAEVENDPAVHETLRLNNLPTTTASTQYEDDDQDDEEGDDAEDDEYIGGSKARGGASTKHGRTSSTGAVQKPCTGLTHSRGGVTLQKKSGRKNRKEYPSSWGCSATQMKMKKRVMCAFDGPRRLWKDDMMLSTDYEVRLPLADGSKYVTDLDVQTLKRAEAFHNATEEEKGSGFFDGKGIDLEKLMEIKREK